MKITAGIDKVEEARPLIEAGADELYCGVYRCDWFSVPGIPSSRPTSRASLKSYKELQKISRIAREREVPVYVTLNHHYPAKDSHILIREDLKMSLDSGADGFIVSDIALIKEIKRDYPGKPVILSTLGNCFNTETVSFYKGLGVDRIVFPRDLTLSELEYLCSEMKRKGLEIPVEAFVQNLRCRNVNGFCRWHSDPALINTASLTAADRLVLKALKAFTKWAPGTFSPYIARYAKIFRDAHPHEMPCLLPYEATFIARADNSRETVPQFHVGEAYDKVCAACAIFYFRKFGIEYLKIVGRGFPTQTKLSDVRFMAALREILNKEPSGFNEFFKKGQEVYQRIYGAPCLQAQCHYPCFVKKRAEDL